MNRSPQKSGDEIANPNVMDADLRGNDFSMSVRRAAANVLGSSNAGREVANLCDRHEAARQLLLEDRGQGMPVIGAIGPTAQGKTKIISWLLSDNLEEISESSASEVPKKQTSEPRMIWYGPSPPAYLDSLQEDYRHYQQERMEPIGLPYLLLDSPACNDANPRAKELATRSLSLASVILLVIRADQIRSEVVTFLTQLSEGSVVIPIVNAIRQQDDSLRQDVDSLLNRLRDIAPNSTITDAVLIEDYELGERSQASIGSTAAGTIAARIHAALGGKWEDERRRLARLAALDKRFYHSLHSVLSDQLPSLTSAVTRLRQESLRIPSEIAEELVGRGGPMQAAIRSRLRLTLLTETAAFWFPYRSVLAILNLTHGAWDRLLISFSGSLPSLIGTVWTSASGRQAEVDSVSEVRKGLQNRGEVAVAERLGPLAEQFRREVDELHYDENKPPSERQRVKLSCVAKLSGLETLQSESQRIFDDEVESVAFTRRSAFLLGLFGTLLFWGLLSAPIVALYSEYLRASWQVFEQFDHATGATQGNPTFAFPTPPASMLLTSFILSLLPTAIFSMLVLSCSQSYRRVRAIEKAIRSRHHEAIETLQTRGVLQLQWDDPLLSDAEFLVTAGSATTPTPLRR